MQACYYDGDSRPSIPLLPNAIAFYAGESGRSRISHVYPSSTNQHWYILDVEVNDLDRIIPLANYLPYVQWAPDRTARELDLVSHVPFWIVTSAGLGVPVMHKDTTSLMHGDKLFEYSRRGLRYSVFVTINWPGYPAWKAQVKMMEKTILSGGGPFTYRRLVNQVKCKIRKFFREHEGRETSNPHWAVGTLEGRISAIDVTLLAIINVSPGRVIPVLKLRDGFIFADVAGPEQ
ncbi:unnamed protein product [Peniophora sp. CBMAI 1063]|nr:unnamed protein product [Peniophora sp. CBMAI 1063]